MRHSDIDLVAPDPVTATYAIAPGATSTSRPPTMCRLGYLATLLWWRTDGPNTGRITTTTRRAMRDPVTGRRKSAGGRMLFVVAATSRLQDGERVALHARARELADQLSVERLLERPDPMEPIVMPMPEGCRLVAPPEVWGTWAACQQAPNRAGARS